MAGRELLLVFLKCVVLNQVNSETNDIGPGEDDVLTVKAFVFWPNATIPFYIDPDNFDQEQSLSIMTALSLFAFKTCLKFAPVMARPQAADHVLLLENSSGVRKCTVNTEPHTSDEPHKVTLGYDCLKSPDIDMMIMKALGFPFEHNRACRDLYIEVQQENVEPGFLDLYTKDLKKPIELNTIPYDINSVMHFRERDYSKNGHKTIVFKNHTARQERFGLSPLDLRKIDVVYGPECQKRDRQEKLELCQNYPGVVRRKRDTTDIPRLSLRVNPDITPPPKLESAADNETKPVAGAASETNTVPRATDESNLADIDSLIKKLGIEKEIDEIVNKVNKVAAAAMTNARNRLCNDTNISVRSEEAVENRPLKSVVDIVNDITIYSNHLLAEATRNLTEFCIEPKSIIDYQRSACPFFDKSKCTPNWKSTKSGAVKVSTKHRPLIKMSTKHSVMNHFRAMSSGEQAKLEAAENPKKDEGKSKDDIEKSLTLTTKIKEDLKLDSELSPNTNSIVTAPVLRSQTRLVTETKKSKYMPIPEYRSNPDKDDPDARRKREVKDVEETVVSVKISTPALKNAKDPKYRKNKKSDLMAEKSIKRRFESQRFRSKRTETRKGEFERGLNERLWDNSGVSLEKYSSIKSTETTREASSHPQLKVKEKKPVTDAKNSAETEITSVRANTDQDDGKDKSNWEAEDSTETKREIRSKVKTSMERSDSLPRVVELNKKNKEFYGEREWPDGVVRYVINDPGDIDIEDVRKRLAEVNDILKRKTCARLEELSEPEADNYEDYLVLDNSPDYVTGRVGGKQIFGVYELLKGGQHRQHAAMMVMAMLGFYFEVSRHDRDKYIRVHMRHVRPDKLHHFEKIRDDATFDLPYDYQSATHPAWQFWRQIGRTGISTVATFKQQDPDGSIMKSLGQNQQLLSDTDIIKINSVYGVKCFTKSQKKKTKKKPEPSREEEEDDSREREDRANARKDYE